MNTRYETPASLKTNRSVRMPVVVFLNPHSRICYRFLEREEEEEGEGENQCEKHQLGVSCTHYNQGLNLQPRHMS